MPIHVLVLVFNKVHVCKSDCVKYSNTFNFSCNNFFFLSTNSECNSYCKKNISESSPGHQIFPIRNWEQGCGGGGDTCQEDVGLQETVAVVLRGPSGS